MVSVEDPSAMNVLGLFLAAALRLNLDERGKRCALRGALRVEAGAMAATVRFSDSGALVTRAMGPATVTISAPMDALVAALVRPGLTTLLRVKVRGSRLFAWRSLGFLKP